MATDVAPHAAPISKGRHMPFHGDLFYNVLNGTMFLATSILLANLMWTDREAFASNFFRQPLLGSAMGLLCIVGTAYMACTAVYCVVTIFHQAVKGCLRPAFKDLQEHPERYGSYLTSTGNTLLDQVGLEAFTPIMAKLATCPDEDLRDLAVELHDMAAAKQQAMDADGQEKARRAQVLAQLAHPEDGHGPENS